MREEWFTNEDKFEVLTKVIRGSVRGGIVKETDLDADEIDLVNEGVEENVFGKDASMACVRCTKKYPIDNIPASCEDCGAEFSRYPPDETTIRFREVVWPDDIKDLLERYIDEFQLSFEKEKSIEEVPIENFHTDDTTYLHISPFYELEHQFLMFPRYEDVFIDWRSLPELIREPEEIQEQIQDFLDTSDLNVSKVGEVADGIEDVYYTGPGAPGPEYSAKSSWYSLLDRVEDKSEAHARSKKRFGINYNEMFERLGMEFLHTLFPHATTIHLGGNHVPDGLLHIQKEDRIFSYLVESKCKSSDFKIFAEQDKASRYVDRFVRNVEGETDSNYNLTGYLFFAHEFDDCRMINDIDSFVDLTASSRDLNVVCINSKMMEEGMGRLAYLYRREPSATYRIYKHSDWYRTAVDGLVEYTREFQTEASEFGSKVLKVFEDKGHKKTSVEERIREGLKPPQSWQDSQEEAGDNIPDDYRISS